MTSQHQAAQPTLFQWEPGMRREGRPDIIARVEVSYYESEGGELELWFDLNVCDDIEKAESYRPDMAHAGTRGLVLEQVRAALGDPHAHIRPLQTLDGLRWIFVSRDYAPALHWATEGACLWDTVTYLSRNRDAEAAVARSDA